MNDSALLVLVAQDCPSCARTVDVVEEVSRMRPGVTIEIVDVGVAGLPDGVPFVGTPSYLMGGRVVALGNPEPEDLITLLDGRSLHGS